jgi:hypothetical protein
MIAAFFGLPRLTLTASGVRIQNVLGSKWAEWSSLGPFQAEVYYVNLITRRRLLAAPVIGQTASRRLWGRKFTIPNTFCVSLAEIADAVVRFKPR